MRSNGRDHLAMVVVEAVELVEVEKRRKPARGRTKEEGSLAEKGRKIEIWRESFQGWLWSSSSEGRVF